MTYCCYSNRRGVYIRVFQNTLRKRGKNVSRKLKIDILSSSGASFRATRRSLRFSQASFSLRVSPLKYGRNDQPLLKRSFERNSHRESTIILISFETVK